MSTGPKKDNRGGAREGAGRKSLSVSTRQLKAIHEAADKKAQKTGKSMWDIVLGWIYDENLNIRERQAAWKMFADKYCVQVSEGGEADQLAGPALYLPDHRPQLEAIDGGKVTNCDPKADEAA